MRKHITKANYDADSIRRQMEKLEVPEVWTPAGSDGTFLGLIRRPDGVKPDEMGQDVPEPSQEDLPPTQELMEERVQADDVGSEEDDIDVKAKFFVSINVRIRHRKLRIWGKCGTKPGQNFSAYEPHNSFKGVKFNSICGHCWKGKDPREEEDSSITTSSSDMD